MLDFYKMRGQEQLLGAILDNCLIQPFIQIFSCQDLLVSPAEQSRNEKDQLAPGGKRRPTNYLPPHSYEGKCGKFHM